MYSVVVPVFNEEETLPELNRRLVGVMSKLDDFEIIYVNDGSQDLSEQLVLDFCESIQAVKLVSLSRNFGHQAAISAGLACSRGDAVAILDGDLQDPPELLPELFAKLDEGFQVVYGVRRKRKENWLKRLMYRVYYRLLRRVADRDIPLDAGDFCAMDREIVDLINSFPEVNRFVRGIRAWVGYKQTGIHYEREPRYAGTPGYTVRKLIQLALDGIFSSSKMPLVLATRLGTLAVMVAIFLTGLTLWKKMVGEVEPLGWASIMITVTFLGGVQLLVVGILGEYIGRIFDQANGRPSYIISRKKNI